MTAGLGLSGVKVCLDLNLSLWARGQASLDRLSRTLQYCVRAALCSRGIRLSFQSSGSGFQRRTRARQNGLSRSQSELTVQLNRTLEARYAYPTWLQLSFA